jgi:hypothetical protein
VDEAYKDGSGSEHGIYQAYKLALYPYALEKISGTYNYREEENLFRSQGPDGGFHTAITRSEHTPEHRRMQRQLPSL